MCLALGVVATLLAAVSCQYDDGAIWEKIDEMDAEIEQNRNDIATLTALIEALDLGKVIIKTEPTNEGVVLTFSDGSTLLIRHGEDGANGQDGDSLFESIEESDTEVIITLSDGRVIHLPKATNGNNHDYELRVLTFEDEDAKFAGYTLYGGAEIDTWSDLVDDMQYGGSLTYTDFMTDTYYWYDQGNTELYHSFTTPYWQGGHVISNYIIEDYSTLPEGHYGWYELQMANPIGGHNGSTNFAVHNGYSDFYNSQIYDSSLQSIEFADGQERVVDHIYITNTCYVLNSLTYGDGFNTPATEETYIWVVAHGYNANDEHIGTLEFALCQQGTPITEWTKWDLSPLGKVAKIAFNITASDDQIGDYGMNSPAYFAYDDVAVRFEK